MSPIRTRTLAVAAALASTVALGAAHDAHAGKVIVLAVAGDKDGEVEDGLSAIVEDHHDIVTSKQVERAAKKQHLDDLDGPSLGKIARKLGADAVVEGSMTREDEGYLLVVRIRAASGKTVKKISLDLPKRALSSKAKKRLGTGVLDGIDKVLGIEGDKGDDGDGGDARDDGDDSARDGGDDDSGRDDRHRARKAAREVADRDGDDRSGDDRSGDDDDHGDRDGDDHDHDRGDRDDRSDRDDRDGDRRVASRDEDDGEDLDMGVRKHAHGEHGGSAMPAVILSVGPSATLRQLSFISRPFAQAPLGYKSSLVPGARIDGELYPLAIGGKTGALAGVGAAFEYDQTLELTTRSSDAPTVALPTSQKHWAVEGRYRMGLGKSAVLTLIGGYGRRTFIVDRKPLPTGAKLDMPDVDYRYFDPGLAVRYNLGSRLSLFAQGQALLIRAAGYIQRTASYGGAKLTGIDARAGLEIRATKKIVVDLAGAFTQIGYAFVGNGQETNNRDLDPTTQDVGGASDRYVNLVGTVGYTY